MSDKTQQDQQPDQQYSDAANQSGVVLNAGDDGQQNTRSQEEIYHEARDKGAGGVVFPDDEPDYATTPDVDGYDESVITADEMREKFHTHFAAQLAHHGRKLDYFMPAYRFGMMLRASDSYPSEKIGEVEGDMQDLWLEENPGRWVEFEEAIRIGWLVTHQTLTDVSVNNEMIQAAASGDVQMTSEAEGEIDPEDTEALEPENG